MQGFDVQHMLTICMQNKLSARAQPSQHRFFQFPMHAGPSACHDINRQNKYLCFDLEHVRNRQAESVKKKKATPPPEFKAMVCAQLLQ